MLTDGWQSSSLAWRSPSQPLGGRTGPPSGRGTPPQGSRGEWGPGGRVPLRSPPHPPTMGKQPRGGPPAPPTGGPSRRARAGAGGRGSGPSRRPPPAASRKPKKKPRKPPITVAAYDAWLAKWLKVKLQPKANAYDGLGLARESVFLDLRHPGFSGRFEEVFTEHVKGWGGYKVSPRAAAPRPRERGLTQGLQGVQQAQVGQ